MVGGDDEMMNSNNNSIPHLFKCPISLDLFRDPVTLCTGQTYDRSYIEKWLAAGNLTCPVTMQKLHDLSLVPNHTLQHLIHHWLCMDTRFNPHSTTFDPKLSLAVLKHNIESHKIAFATRLEALAKIRILSEELEWRRTYLIQLGFFPILLRLLFTKLSLVEGMLAKQDSDIAEEALHCVLNLLPFSDMSCLNVLKQDSHLGTFLVLLKQGSSEIKMKLCYLVGAIASCSKTRELCLMLGQSRCFLRGLMDLLHDNSQEASEAAANEAILAVCSFHSNRESFIKQDGVGSLLSYLSNKPRQASVSLAALELLLESNSGKQALLNNANGVHILVNMVFGVCFDHRGSESAVSSLLSLCYESVKVREEAICAGVLTQLLLLLQSQCSSKAKNKGRVLLKLLRSM